jgi:16S rRNA (uracil1498-N3)-methyltransferase
MARRRFFVEEVHSGRAHIAGDQARHLSRVLRVEPGQKFEISDNRNVYLAEVESASKDLVSFAIVEQIDASSPVVHSALLASLIKFEPFEWMLEKATELGVERVIPVEAERSEKGLAAAAGKRFSRWNRIAREASEQSRRARLPLIDPAVNLSSALRNQADYRYVLEEAVAPPILSVVPGACNREDRVALMVGPEGGWTARERVEIAAAGWAAVSLGPAILRAETAAIAAMSVIHAAWNARSPR